MIARVILPLVSIFAILAGVAGCGGGDSGSSSDASIPTVTTSSLTPAQFAKQANTICLDERQQIPTRVLTFEEKNGFEGNLAPEDYADEVQVALLPLFQNEVIKIAKLGAPSGDGSQVEAILTADQEAIDELKEMSSIASVKVVAGQFAAASALMGKYGLTSCTIVAEPGAS